MSVYLPEEWWFSVHSCVRGRIAVHLLEGSWCCCIHVWGVRYRCIYLRSWMHSCVRDQMHLLEGWWSRCIHVCGVGYRCFYLRIDDLRCIHVWGVGYRCIYLRSDDLRCIHVWGVGFRCIYLRVDDLSAFMCEGQDSGAFTWGMMISVHSCMRCRMSVHFPEEWRFVVHSCVRGKIPVRLLEGWQFLCLHVWGVGYQCIYLRDDDFGAFMCEG